MDESLTWKIIDLYFQANPNFLSKHHLSSYDQFMLEDLPNILKTNNPIPFMQEPIKTQSKTQLLQCNIFVGGKDGARIFYGKPTIYDAARDDKVHCMYPNEARLRNMTYGVSVHVDIDVEVSYDSGEKETVLLKNIYFGRFPIMLQSKLCILHGLEPMVRYNMGECVSDPGGYFIIDGKEKVIISQEKFASNMMNIKKLKKSDTSTDKYATIIEMHSVSEDASKPVRKLSVCVVRETTAFSNNQIVVNIPNVQIPVPLFVVMRALGVISDKSIIEHCLLDYQANRSMVELFIPSVHDAGAIFSQETAVKYIASFVKGRSTDTAMFILCNYLLPHVGTTNYIEKAYYLGYMVNRMLKVHVGIDSPTDRDSFKYKRIELSGNLLSSLFKEYYKLHINAMILALDTYYNRHKETHQDKNFKDLFTKERFEEQERTVEIGMKKAFKGNWGAQTYTKRIGVVQDLKRLSFNATVAHLRMCSLPFDSSAKVSGPRLLHSSQWGMIDPIDTPDGENVGLHKNLAIATSVSDGYSKDNLVEFLFGLYVKKHQIITKITDCHPCELFKMVRVFVNGGWHGSTKFPEELMQLLKNYRRMSVIPFSTSLSWNISEKNIYIFTDAGRLIRPLFYLEKGRLNTAALNHAGMSWKSITRGSMLPDDYDPRRVYKDVRELYANRPVSDLDNPEKKPAVEYVDTAESENCMISFEDVGEQYTHREIHASFLLGVMGNQVVFPENNQLPRDLFSCGQGKQAVSMYSTNYQNRIDTMGVVLNYGQIPLVKSRYLKYINNEKNPYGVNTIVAIMCYSGYNVEDSIIFNQAAIDRGLFNTSYFSSYETHEEINEGNDSRVEIMNVLDKDVTTKNPGYNYTHLDKDGLIRENTKLDDKTVMIGQASVSNYSTRDKMMVDASVTASKGQTGYVDKAFITEGEGTRTAKIRVREERMPEIGDKFVSRVGQKGTCGVILKEVDMPYTSNGVRPDIIINPHALPSRMTIGQLLEMLMGKVHLQYGGFGDCTAFNNKGLKAETYGNILNKMHFHNSGNEVLYNGMSGEQIKSDIFIGPTYYLRLKHMVKDKINYRNTGPNTLLTRQPVQGRSNDGGLRIGEMERDGLLANGMTKFVQDSFLTRGDEYSMTVDNASGMIAICNPQKNLFISPVVDGPLIDDLSLVAKCIEDQSILENVSKHEKTFSAVKLPYAFKLLIQELTAINVQMRLVTEDNADHLTSLSFSDNIKKLMNEPTVHIMDAINHVKNKNSRIRRGPVNSLPPVSVEPTFKVSDMVIIKNDASRVWEILSLDRNNTVSLRHNTELKKFVDMKDLHSPKKMSNLSELRFQKGDIVSYVSYDNDDHYYRVEHVKENETVILKRNKKAEIPFDFIRVITKGDKVLREIDKRIGTFESTNGKGKITVIYDDGESTDETIFTILKDKSPPVIPNSASGGAADLSPAPIPPAPAPVQATAQAPAPAPVQATVQATVPQAPDPVPVPASGVTTESSSGGSVNVHLGLFNSGKDTTKLSLSIPHLTGTESLNPTIDGGSASKKIIVMDL